MVSPIWMSAIPEIATMEPTVASFTSTLLRPSNSYNLLIFTFFIYGWIMVVYKKCILGFTRIEPILNFTNTNSSKHIH